ncbi:hypothetical protein [Streptomyces sp. B21-083]|uniref:hypothetical protein n=1 Tax=Streptomyces sp. B21-083 TaxID=3039410 RepID=UPI002FF40410
MTPHRSSTQEQRISERRIGSALAAVGAPLTLAGALMYVLPGPGFPVLVIGLALLITGLVMVAAGNLRRPTRVSELRFRQQPERDDGDALAVARPGSLHSPELRRRPVKQVPQWWAEIRSVTAWWITVTLLLWLLGMALGQPVRLAGCAASAAVLVAIGETGDWLRRRWASHRGGGRRGPGPDGGEG